MVLQWYLSQKRRSTMIQNKHWTVLAEEWSTRWRNKCNKFEQRMTGRSKVRGHSIRREWSILTIQKMWHSWDYLSSCLLFISIQLQTETSKHHGRRKRSSRGISSFDRTQQTIKCKSCAQHHRQQLCKWFTTQQQINVLCNKKSLRVFTYNLPGRRLHSMRVDCW